VQGERRVTIDTLRQEAVRVGEDTPLGQVMMRMAATFTARPGAAPAHAPLPPVGLQAMLPASATMGLERSLPIGDRDEDPSDAAVLSLFDREPGNDG